MIRIYLLVQDITQERVLSFKKGESLYGVVANVVDCDIVGSEFKLFFGQIPLGKVWTPLILRLNCTNSILLQGWLWHWITHKGWYAIKQRKQTKKGETPSCSC